MQELHIGKPSASLIAGCSTSDSDFVPHFARAIAAESTAAGTVAPSGPLPGIASLPAKSLDYGLRRGPLTVDDDHSNRTHYR